MICWNSSLFGRKPFAPYTINIEIFKANFPEVKTSFIHNVFVCVCIWTLMVLYFPLWCNHVEIPEHNFLFGRKIEKTKITVSTSFSSFNFRWQSRNIIKRLTRTTFFLNNLFDKHVSMSKTWTNRFLCITYD